MPVFGRVKEELKQIAEQPYDDETQHCKHYAAQAVECLSRGGYKAAVDYRQLKDGSWHAAVTYTDEDGSIRFYEPQAGFDMSQDEAAQTYTEQYGATTRLADKVTSALGGLFKNL